MSIIEMPLQLQHLALKNRVIRSAVHSFLAGEDGYMTAAEYAMYETLAENNLGTIISGHCCVDPLGRANPEQVNIYADSFTDQFRKVVAIAHAHDARFIAQINHAGPRAIDNEDLADVVARPLKKGRHARALTVEEIHHIEQCFIAAAKRLQSAGCDGVQLHAAHSYLLSRFIDPTFNQREDAYGGTIENRFRMVEEIIRGIHEACGKDFPVLIKVNVDTKAEDARATTATWSGCCSVRRRSAWNSSSSRASTSSTCRRRRRSTTCRRSSDCAPKCRHAAEPCRRRALARGHGGGHRGWHRVCLARPLIDRGAGLRHEGARGRREVHLCLVQPLLRAAAHAPGHPLRLGLEKRARASETGRC